MRLMPEYITKEEFAKIEIRVGKIIEVEKVEGLQKSFYKLLLDFGPSLGKKTSLAQLTHYSREDLLGKEVACVTNLKPLKIGPYISEVLILGFPDEKGRAIILVPEREVPLGEKAF